MASTKITNLTAIASASIASNDQMTLVDVSDTSMAGSGTNKKVPVNAISDKYWTRTSALTYLTNAGDVVGIGISSAADNTWALRSAGKARIGDQDLSLPLLATISPLTVVPDANFAPPANLFGFQTFAGVGAQIRQWRSGGLIASPAGVTQNMILGGFETYGMVSGATWAGAAAAVYSKAAETFTSAAQGQYLSFHTVEAGSNTSLVEKVRVTTSGAFGVGTSAATSSKVHAFASAADCLYRAEINDDFFAGMEMYNAGTRKGYTYWDQVNGELHLSTDATGSVIKNEIAGNIYVQVDSNEVAINNVLHVDVSSVNPSGAADGDATLYIEKNTSLGYIQQVVASGGISGFTLGDASNPYYIDMEADTANDSFDWYLGNIQHTFKSTLTHFNTTKADMDFRVDTDNAASTLHVNGGLDNIGVNTSAPASAALLDMSSTSKGFRPPQMTSAQMAAIASPVSGLMVYNTTSNALFFYNGAWGAI